MSDHSNIRLFQKGVGLWNNDPSYLVLAQQILSNEILTTLYGKRSGVQYCRIA